MQLISANKMTFHRSPIQHLCQEELLHKRSLSGSKARISVRLTNEIAKSLYLFYSLFQKHQVSNHNIQNYKIYTDLRYQPVLYKGQKRKNLAFIQI